MSSINQLGGSAVNSATLEKSEEAASADQTQKTSTASAVAPSDTLSLGGTGVANVAGSLVSAPVPPAVQMDENAMSAASSFGYQLGEVGKQAADSDILLAQFMKLQILAGEFDLLNSYLAGNAVSMLKGANALDGLKNTERPDLRAQANDAESKASQVILAGTDDKGNVSSEAITEASALKSQADSLNDTADNAGIIVRDAAAVANSRRKSDKVGDSNGLDSSSKEMMERLRRMLEEQGKDKKATNELVAQMEANRAEVIRLLSNFVEQKKDSTAAISNSFAP